MVGTGGEEIVFATRNRGARRRAGIASVVVDCWCWRAKVEVVSSSIIARLRSR